MTIPLDEDTNHIADGWEHNEGAATDDDETDPPGDGTPGDGLTRYEEYRGVLVQGAHMRTDPTQKDYFGADWSGIGTLGSFVSPGMPLAHRLRPVETQGPGSRVDFNSETAPGGAVYAPQMLYMGLAEEGRLGECTGPVWTSNTWVRIDRDKIAQVVVPPHTAAELEDWVIAHELGHTVLWHQGGDAHGHHGGATDDDCVMYTPGDTRRAQYPTTFTLGNPACRILWKVRQ